MLNTCVCCGREIPEGRQVCKHCEHDANIPIKKKDHSILIKIARIVISAVIVVAALICFAVCFSIEEIRRLFFEILKSFSIQLKVG